MAQLDISLFPWQEKVWADPARFKIVAAGRRTGKSRLAAYRLLVEALQGPAEADYCYVAPTQGQARRIMWKLLLELGKDVISGTHVNNLEINLVTGATIYLLGADRPDTMRGMSIKFLVLDEYADIRPDVFEEILRPALSDRQGDVIFIGTPKGRNHFWDLYCLGADADNKSYQSFHFTSRDNPLIPPEEIEEARATLSSFAFQQEYEASFRTRGSEKFREEWVQFAAEPVEGDYYIAIDPAGFAAEGARGNRRLDETAIAVVKVHEGGWHVKKIIHGRWTLKETVRRIFNAVVRYRPVKVGIERGIAQQAIMSPLQAEMRRQQRPFAIELLTHGNQKKVDRIVWALQGKFENGRVTLEEPKDDEPSGKWVPALLDQLYNFPDPLVHDDLIDALAYVDQLADTYYNADALEADEYEPLDAWSGF